MGAIVDTDMLELYDRSGVAPYINDYGCEKVEATVSGSTLTFSKENVPQDVIIDGPYIEDVSIEHLSVTVNNNSIVYVLADSSADTKDAYIWIRYAS